MRNKILLSGVGLALAASLAVASPAAAHTPAEAANKQLVLDFYAALNRADAAGTTKDAIKGIAETYLSPDYLQHAEALANMPGPGSARDKMVAMFQNMPPRGGPPLPAPKTLAVMAEGDLVMMLTSREQPDPASGTVKSAYIFNMFRVKNGKLVEHWDVMPSMAGGPPGGPPPGAGGPPPGAGGPPPGALPPGAGGPPPGAH